GRGPGRRTRRPLPRSALRRPAAARRGGPRARRGPEHPADGRTVRRGRPDRAPRAPAGAAAPAARPAQDDRLRHPRRRRGLPARGPGGDPPARRDHRPGGHPAGDPRRSGRRLRLPLRRRRARRAHPPRRARRRARRGGRRRRTGRRGARGTGRPGPRRCGARRCGPRRCDPRRARPGAVLVSWVLGNLDVIAGYTGAHLVQALPPILIAFLLSLPLAKLANSRGWLRTSVTTGSSLMYAIPSLPLFVLLPGLIGTGVRSPANIIIALSLYGLALMVPTASDAFRSVSRDVLGSATAQGFAPRARFLQVELPLAGPVLLGGVRVVAVSTISLVTVGGVLGVPSLGMLFVDGVRRGIAAEIAAGIVATVALALLTDALLVLLGRAVMPWTRRPEVRRP